MWQTLMYWTQNTAEKHYEGGWKKSYGIEIKLFRAMAKFGVVKLKLNMNLSLIVCCGQH